MKPPDRKWPQAKAAGRHPERPTPTLPTPFKSPVVQAKTAAPANAARHPVAPPVYRPQPKPPAVQRKTAAPIPTRTTPTPPPAYRPQPRPLVLQTKAAHTPQSAQAKAEAKRPSAPAVYRPQPTPKVLQRKVVGGSQSVKAQSGQKPFAQPGADAAARARMSPTPLPRSISSTRPHPRSPAVHAGAPFGPRVIQRMSDKDKKSVEVVPEPTPTPPSPPPVHVAAAAPAAAAAAAGRDEIKSPPPTSAGAGAPASATPPAVVFKSFEQWGDENKPVGPPPQGIMVQVQQKDRAVRYYNTLLSQVDKILKNDTGDEKKDYQLEYLLAVRDDRDDIKRFLLDPKPSQVQHKDVERVFKHLLGLLGSPATIEKKVVNKESKQNSSSSAGTVDLTPLDADPTINIQKSGCDAQVIVRWVDLEGGIKKKASKSGSALSESAGSHAEREAWRLSKAEVKKWMKTYNIVQIEFHITYAPCPECKVWFGTTLTSDVKSLVETENRERGKRKAAMSMPKIIAKSYHTSAYGKAGEQTY